MKKIAAFFTAFVLFIIVVICIHFTFSSSMNMENPKFGTWVNSYKDLSYNAISENITDKSFLLLGSSEFEHGRNTLFHPSVLFNNQKMDVMIIGAAYDQSFSHTITLASVGPKLKSKKVVLLISPTWFGKDGVSAQVFSVRFSESEYMAILENNSLSLDTKRAIAARTVSLLSTDTAMQNRVKLYNKIFIDKNPSGFDNVYYKIRKSFITEKEMASVDAAWALTGQKYDRSKMQIPTKNNSPNWDMLHEMANKVDLGKATNPFFMQNSVFNHKIKKVMKIKHNSNVGRSFASSTEYGDLKLFLDVCKEENIDVMLVILPINGYWYDYTGFPKAGRDVLVENIDKIGKSYGVNVNNLFKYSYTPGFFEDAVHPVGKGWVEINEQTYDFFRQN